MAPPDVEFTWEQVQEHTSKKDCWVVIDGAVHDVSSFLAKHPGGDKMILDRAGTDCSEDFDGLHSKDARDLLSSFAIGRIEPGPAPLSKSSTQYIKYEVVDKKSGNGASSVELIFRQAEGAPPNPKCFPFAARSLNKLVNKSKFKGSALSNALSVWSDSPTSGQHVMIKADIPGKGIVIRPYTPLEWFEDGFRLMVKVYRADPSKGFPEGGAMSQYLDSLDVGSSLLVSNRIGHIEYQLPGGKLVVNHTPLAVSQIGFLCAGSGITPAFQIIRNSLLDPFDKKKFILLYASASAEEIMLRSELDQMQQTHPDRLEITYIVSNEPGDSNCTVGRLTAKMIQEKLPDGDSETCFVGICGPPGFIDDLCLPALKSHGYFEDYFACF